MNKSSSPLAPFRMALIATGLLAALATVSVQAADGDAPKAHSENLGTAISDAAVTGKVKAKLMGESALKDSDISVVTTNGVVTLQGSAASSAAKSLAENATRSVDGVNSVDNNLVTHSHSRAGEKVKSTVATSKQVISDSWISTKVKALILADSISKGFEVNVDTYDGVVVLKGVLSNQSAVDYVKDIASKVEGVKSVDVSMLFVAGK